MKPNVGCGAGEVMDGCGLNFLRVYGMFRGHE